MNQQHLAEGVAQEYFDGGLHKNGTAVNDFSLETKSPILSK